MTTRPAVLSRHAVIAGVAVAGIGLYLVLRFLAGTPAPAVHVPLYVVLVAGGAPLVAELALSTARGQFGADLLAGVSIVTAVLLGEYLAGAVVVLMLSSGQAMEAYAVGRASSVLSALARRIPSVAHRLKGRQTEDIALDAVEVGDRIVVYPHEVCPVDGIVVEGRGIMDESYLTGEPFMMSKTPGSKVFSGAINGDQALTLRATRLAVDSRYARIMTVMRDSEQRRPRLRRLGDQLGALYTPAAMSIAAGAWAWSGDPNRFLAVLVVATPCPLLIAIPVTIIGSISLAAKRSIIVRDPAVLERLGQCRTIVLDKTGTLTYGRPVLTEQMTVPGLDALEVLELAATVERYSKHPLAAPVLDAARKARLTLPEASRITERPGEGVEGTIDGHQVQILGRRQAETRGMGAALPPVASGLECVVLVDGQYAATYRFRDEAREDGRPFISHLQPQHRIERILLVSGDRAEEVRYLAELVGITETYSSQSPEQKVEITRAEMARAPTLFVGDGINDAPALVTATIGLAFGNTAEITTEAAGAVVMDTSLRRIDEFLHIGRRMRRIALQSALGGMALSVVGMLVAFAGYLPPVAGAVAQEIIDLAVVLNALRAAVPGGELSDY